MLMNKLAAFFAIAMSRIKAMPWNPPAPNGNRGRIRRERGYTVNGQRVYYRRAAPWVPNKKGTRFQRGVRVDRHTGQPV